MTRWRERGINNTIAKSKKQRPCSFEIGNAAFVFCRKAVITWRESAGNVGYKMENASLAPKMRRIAGVLYGAFFLLQLLSLKHSLLNGNLSYINYTYSALYVQTLDKLNVALGLLAGAFCVWLIAGADSVSAKVSRGTVAATVLVVISNFMFFNGHMTFLHETMLTQFPFNAFVTESNVGLLSVVMFGVQVVLLILAAFFVTSAQLPAEAAEEEEDFEEEESFDEDENPDTVDMLERDQEETAEQQDEDALEEMSEEEKREMTERISQAVEDSVSTPDESSEEE